MERADPAGRLVKIGLGLLILLASVLGGNTTSGLNSDILIFGVLLVCALAMPAIRMRKIGPVPIVFAVAVLCSIGLQLIPVGQLLNGWPDAPLRSGFISLDVLETFRVLVAFICAYIVFLLTMSVGYAHARGLLPFMYVGLCCNLLVAVVQFSSQTALMRDSFFDYPLNGGFFINQNHFSTFILVFIPFLLFTMVYQEQKKFAGLTLCFLLLIILAAGSMAGTALGLLVTLVSALALVERRRISLLAGLGGLLLLGIYLTGLEAQFAFEGGASWETRLQFALTTIEGIRSYFWTGVGYGTFADAYAMFISPDEIRTWYVNHAHNDYLEAVFEGGISALALILAYLALYLRQVVVSWSDPFKRCAAIGIAIVLLHSAVDYPLRTSTMLFVFAVLNGILFHRGRRVRIAQAKAMPVSVNGEEISVPFRPITG